LKKNGGLHLNKSIEENLFNSAYTEKYVHHSELMGMPYKRARQD